jgi:hypothetical protein
MAISFPKIPNISKNFTNNNQKATGSAVQRFISSINRYQDLQRQSRFEVRFPIIPKCFSSLPGCNTLADLTLRCEAVDLPGRVFNTFDHRTYGPIIKYPTQTIFPDITLTFLCSSNRAGTSEIRDDLGGRVGYGASALTGMDEKVTFENWMNYINPYPAEYKQPGNVYHNFRYRQDYVAEIDVICFDTADNPAYKMTFVGAYPTTVMPVGMTWATEEVARLSVVFTYEYFRYTNECVCETAQPVIVCTTQDPIRTEQPAPAAPPARQPDRDPNLGVPGTPPGRAPSVFVDPDTGVPYGA